MDGESSTCTYDEIESIILDQSSGPCSLPLEYLRRITNNFSDERLLGQGGSGKVYKGVLQNGNVVAIKRLDQLLKPEVQERKFQNEVYHLMRLDHPNIVRFLGYCYETQNECVEHNGKFIFAEKQQKLICLEYLPNGSLDRHLSDESSGHEWNTRYKIIKGICCGLLYLHEEYQCQFGASIIHLDLKPGNILLDENMGPKITDFGLSRLFEDNKTQIATFLSGSLGYMAPEYLSRRRVTAKADIYSLGVIIIDIITGRSREVDIFSLSAYPTCREEFMHRVINRWRKRPGEARAPSETDCKQIKHCLEIGLGCINRKRNERPTSREIIEKLDGWETANCYSEKSSAVDQIVLAGAADNNPSNTGAGRADLFHGHLSRVKKFLSCILMMCSRHGGVGYSSDTSGDSDWFSPAKYALRSAGSYDSHPSSVRDPSEEFTFAQMEAATQGFSPEAKIGEGSFGTVYRGYLPDGREVAIKRRESGPRRFQESEFKLEVAFLSQFRHKNLVGVIGYCVEKKERLLICEYMKNGALYDHLHLNAAPSEPSPPSPVMSSWQLRIRILLEASRGIHYLHSSCLIIHERVKSSNILLDASWRARVSDFRLSSLMTWEEEEEAQMHRSSIKAAEMVAYMDPEYDSFTFKRDVYSFGVVMLEVLTGKRAILEQPEGPLSVVDYAVPSIVSGELAKVLDPRMPEPAADEAEALGLVAYTALHCVQLKGKDRPGMQGVVASLRTAFGLCKGSSFDDDLFGSTSSDSLDSL